MSFVGGDLLSFISSMALCSSPKVSEDLRFSIIWFVSQLVMYLKARFFAPKISPNALRLV